MEKVKVVENPLSLSKSPLYMVNQDILKFIKCNRISTDSRHVAEIKSAMIAQQFIPAIIADRSTLYIIDGQHRYLAAKELWEAGIPYELDVELGDFQDPLATAIELNGKRLAWKLPDYVNAYKELKEPYRLLWEFEESHSDITMYTACQLLTGKRFVKAAKGCLSISDTDVARANTLYRELAQMSAATKDSNIMRRNIVLAYCNNRDYLLQKFGTFEKFLKALRRNYRKPATDSVKIYSQMYITVK